MPSLLSEDPLNPTNPSSIPPTAMPLISPTALLRAHLQQTPPTRPSTRSPNQPHKIDLNTSSLTHTNGSSVVKIGATTIICGVRAEILPVSEIPSYDPKTNAATNDQGKDDISSPEHHTPLSLYNLVVPNIELSTGCSSLHPANSAPSAQAQSLSQRLYTLLLTSNLIRHSDLAITYTPPADDSGLDPDDPAFVPRETETKAFWVLYIDMLCISYGGEASVFDAAWLSLYAALQDTRLPRAWWDADEKSVLCDREVEKGWRLKLRGCPVPLSFGVVMGEKDERWVVVDPDAFEEQCCDEVGCVVADFGSGKEKGRLLRIEKVGGGVVGKAEVKELLGVVQRRWEEWNALLKRLNVGGS